MGRWFESSSANHLRKIRYLKHLHLRENPSKREFFAPVLNKRPGFAAHAVLPFAVALIMFATLISRSEMLWSCSPRWPSGGRLGCNCVATMNIAPGHDDVRTKRQRRR